EDGFYSLAYTSGLSTGTRLKATWGYERSMKRGDLRSHKSVRRGTRGLDVNGWDRAARIHRFGDELEETIKRSPISFLRIYPRWIAWGRAIVSRHDYSKALQREKV